MAKATASALTGTKDTANPAIPNTYKARIAAATIMIYQLQEKEKGVQR